MNSVIHPGTEIGANADLDEFVILGRPPRSSSSGELTLVLGKNATIRSHSVIYAGSTIGDEFQCGHGVMIRECCKIGDNCSVGTGSVLEFKVTLGCGVRVHSQCFIPEYSVLEDGCWLGPNVVLTNARYPQAQRTKELLSGVRIGYKAKIGANSTILPGIVVGAHALVGAGSVVTKNVEDGAIVIGNPAVMIGNIDALRYSDTNELVYFGDKK